MSFAFFLRFRARLATGYLQLSVVFEYGWDLSVGNSRNGQKDLIGFLFNTISRISLNAELNSPTSVELPQSGI